MANDSDDDFTSWIHADDIDWGPLVQAPTSRPPDAFTNRPVDVLVADIVALEAHVDSLQADVRVYREMLARCLDAIRGLVKQRTAAREQLHRVQDRYRHLRERVMRGE